MGDRRSESVNRSLTVSPRHAPLTRGLNIKPRPFLGWAARFLSLLLPSLLFSSRAFASSTRQRWRTGTCTTSPLSIFDRVKQTATGSHLYRDNSCNFGGSSSMWNVVPRRTRKCSDCRRVVGWLHGAASSRDRDLLRKLGPLVLLLDRHRLLLLRYGPLAEFALWLPRIGRSNFFAIPFFSSFAWWTGGTIERIRKKKNGRCNFRRCSNYRSKRKIKDKKDVLLIQDSWINCYRTVRLFEIVRLVLKIERMEYFGRM